MNIRDFLDLSLLDNIMMTWSEATGMAAVAADTEGKYISNTVSYTDFCTKYTRGSKEGLRRCKKCDTECTGTYFCHAGLMDFNIDIVVNNTVLGKVMGGQVLPKEPDEDEFRNLAVELGIDPEQYIRALRKVPIRTEKAIRSSAILLGELVNMLVNNEFTKFTEGPMLKVLDTEITNSSSLLQVVNEKTKDLESIQGKQRILALNASIEAARAGGLAKGFAVVATEVGKLAEDSAKVNAHIKESMQKLNISINEMQKAKLKKDA